MGFGYQNSAMRVPPFRFRFALFSACVLTTGAVVSAQLDAPVRETPIDADRDAELVDQVLDAKRRFHQAAAEVGRIQRELSADKETYARLFGPQPAMVGISMRGDTAGLRVLHVVGGSPAESAGIQSDDLIVRVNGYDVTKEPAALQVEVMQSLMRRVEPGQSVRLMVDRDGAELSLSVVTAPAEQVDELRQVERTTQDNANPVGRARDRREERMRRDPRRSTMMASLGPLHFLDMNTDLGRYFGAETGVLIARVDDEESPLEGGDVILKIGPQQPADAAEVVRLIKEYSEEELVPFAILRGGNPLRFELEVDFGS